MSPATRRRERFEQPEAAPQFGPVRPERLSVTPRDDGRYAIDVSWQGRECVLRAVVVRRMLVDAGYDAEPGNSQDGRRWELHVDSLRADDVARVIDTYIW